MLFYKETRLIKFIILRNKHRLLKILAATPCLTKGERPKALRKHWICEGEYVFRPYLIVCLHETTH